MSQKKNIDDLFRESVTGYSAQPSYRVWQNIQEKFPEGAVNSRRWIIYSLAALLLLLGGVSGWLYFSNDPGDTIEITSIGHADKGNNGEIIHNTEKPISESKTFIEEAEKNEDANDIVLENNAESSSSSEVPFSNNDDIITDNSEPEAIVLQYEIAEEKYLENQNAPSVYKDIAFLNSMDLMFENDIDLSIDDQDELKGLELFLEKKKKGVLPITDALAMSLVH